MSHSLLISNARILTLASGDLPRCDPAVQEIDALDHHCVLIENGRIARVAPSSIHAPSAKHIDANGRVVMPAFVDCHTHACWAGDRLDEWELKQRGATYLEILKSGGGIMSTVRAVRQASVEELTESLLERLDIMLGEGTTA